MKKTLLFAITAIFAIVVILLLFIVFSYYSRRPALIPNPALITPTPVRLIPIKLEKIPPQTNAIPTISPYQVNVSAPKTQASIQEIEKLNTALPFRDSFVSSTNIPVQIYIPHINPDGTNWVLPVEITGINYQVMTGDSSYTSMKQSFQEAVKIVFDFLDKNNIDRSKVFVSWGDRAYIQDQAQNWLEK